MEQFGEMVQPFLTKEVVTVIGAIAVAWVGWKAAVKGTQLAGNFASRASFAGLTAATMLMAGLGGIGAGIGELASRNGSPDEEKPVQTQLTNEQLVNLATNESTNRESLSEILSYTQARDSATRKAVNHVMDREGNIWVRSLDAGKIATGDTLPVSYQKPQNQTPNDLPFKVTEVEKSAIKNDESIMSTPMAWTSIALGLGSVVAGAFVFGTRKRNVA